jgi:hypothetical protein
MLGSHESIASPLGFPSSAKGRNEVRGGALPSSHHRNSALRLVAYFYFYYGI